MIESLNLDGLLNQLFKFDDGSISDGMEVIRWGIKRPSILFAECCTYNYGSYGG